MSERSALAQAVQVGVEVTPGTGVAANRVLQSLNLAPAIKAEVEAFRSTGFKWPGTAVLGKEWSETKVEGFPSYTEIVYPLSSVLTAPVITTPGGGTVTRLWTFSPLSVGADAPVTFTVESGEAGAGNARRTVGNIMTGFGLKLSRGEATVDGSVLGRVMELNRTLTPSPALFAPMPMAPGHFSMFLDATAAALGTTRLTRGFDMELSIGDRFGPVWPIDAAQPSFAGTVETGPSGDVSLTVAADAAGLGVLTAMRLGAIRFLRIRAEGPVIEGALINSLTIDLALRVVDVKEFSDEDGVYCIGYEFAIVHDMTWGRAIQAAVQTTTTAL